MSTMSLQFQVLLIVVLVARQTVAGSCDKQPLPELWFKLNGNNLNWPCESTLSLHESSGRYLPRNVIQTRAQIYKDEAYVAMPRYRPGVPFSLGVLSIKPKNKVNSLTYIRAFPSLMANEEGNCEALQNVVDLVIDRYGVLWALDIGVVNSLEQPIRRCPPKIIAVDLKSKNKDDVKVIIDLSPFVDDGSRLQHLVVDTSVKDETHLYVSDAGRRSLVVYNANKATGFNVLLPQAISEDCPLKDVLYLALVNRGESAVLYFTYLSSSRIFTIGTDKLRKGEVRGYIDEAGRKEGKIAILGTDNGQAIFFRNKGQSDVYMWNTNTEFKDNNFVLVQRGNDCRMPTHVMPGSRKLMWTIESNFHDYIQETIGSAGASVALHPIVKFGDDLS